MPKQTTRQNKRMNASRNRPADSLRSATPSRDVVSLAGGSTLAFGKQELTPASYARTNLMKLRSLSRVYAVCAVSLLCTCFGCRENSTNNLSSGDLVPVETVPSPSSDSDVSADQLLKMAEDKLEAKQYEKAIELFTELAERSPTATKRALIGDCYWKQGKLEQADIHYRQALELDPKHCGANFALGRDAVLQKRYQDATPYLDTATQVCTGTVVHAKALRLRVEAFLELDRMTEAESDLRELVTEYSENASTYEAGLLVARKKGDESLAAEYEAKLNANSNGEPR